MLTSRVLSQDQRGWWKQSGSSGRIATTERARLTWNGHLFKPVLPQGHNMLILECTGLNMWLHTSHCEHLCKFPQMKMPRQKCQFLTSGPIRKDPRSVPSSNWACAEAWVLLVWNSTGRYQHVCQFLGGGNWELFKYQDLLMICYDWACAGGGVAFQNFYPPSIAPQRRYLQDSIT